MIKVRNVDIKDGRRHINHVFSTKEKAADMENLLTSTKIHLGVEECEKQDQSRFFQDHERK